jgi:hypothetical protein
MQMTISIIFILLYVISVIAVLISLKEEYKKQPPSDYEDYITDRIWAFIPLVNLGLLTK